MDRPVFALQSVSLNSIVQENFFPQSACFFFSGSRIGEGSANFQRVFRKNCFHIPSTSENASADQRVICRDLESQK